MSLTSPYKGLVPYSEEDREFFFGRDAEREIITANLLAARLTLLYGASGVGKSSVLNAGVISHLKEIAEEELTERGFPEFVVVSFRSWRDDPLTTLTRQIQTSVAEALAEKAATEPVNPLSLVETLDDCMQRLRGKLIIILDQFEEYFLYHGQADGEGTFAVEFPRAVGRGNLRVSFLISIREDALAKLDRFKGRIPNLFDNYLRIEHLDCEAAREAIRKPIAQYLLKHGDQGQPTGIENGLVEVLLQQVRTGAVVLGEKGRGETGNETDQIRIEAPYLQLVMERLWNTERQNKSPEIRLATLTELGGASSIVRKHLHDVMVELPENEQAAAAEIFDRLVTPSGSKIAHTAPDLISYAQSSHSLLQPASIEALLESLSQPDTRILRAVPGPLDQPQLSRYEIFHDVLAAAVLNWRAVYVQKQEKAQAERLAAEEAAKQAEETKRKLAYTQAMAAEQQARAKQFRQGFIAALSFLVVMIALFIWAWQQRQSAKAAVKAAQESKSAAQASGLLANAVLQSGHDADLSTLLAVESVQIRPTEQAEGILRKSLIQPHAQLILQGDEAFLRAVFSPDGKRLAAASRDGKAFVWEDSSGKWEQDATKKLATLSGHTQEVGSVAFSHDGLSLVTASKDTTARLWDVATGQQKPFVLPHNEAVNTAVFSPDGASVLTACDDGVARVWEAATGKLLGELRGHENAVTDANYSSDGRRIVTSSKDRTVRIWDARSGNSLKVLAKSDEIRSIFSAEFSPDGRQIITASWPRTVRVWDAASLTRRHEVAGHEAPVTIASFSPKAKWIITASEDGKVNVWETETEYKISDLAGHSGTVTDAAFSPDGKWIVTTGRDKTVRVWLSPTESGFLELSGHQGLVNSVAVSPDGRSVAAASSDGHAFVWDVTNSASPPRLLAHKDKVKTVAFSPDGNWIVTGGDDWVARVWPANGGEPVELQDGRRTVYQALFSPDSRRLLTTTHLDYVVTVWETGTWRKLSSLRGEHAKYITSAEFNRDGQKVLTASQDGTAVVWDVARQQPLLKLPKQNASINAAAFSPDDQLIVTANEDRVAVLWEAATGREKFRLAHDDAVTRASFSPDGQWLLTASNDATARIWDVKTGTERCRLSGLGQVYSAAFSTNGKWVVTTHGDKVARIWDAKTGAKLNEIRHLDATLTKASFVPACNQPDGKCKDGERIVIVGNDSKAHSSMWIHECAVCDSLDRLLALVGERVKRKLTPEERQKYLPEK